MHRGYVKLWRCFHDDEFWTAKREFSYWEAWEDIFVEANHSDTTVIIGNTTIECKRGQCVKSLETWQRRWHWHSKSKVRRFLMLCTKLSKIRYESETVTIRITVCSYDKYQDTRNENETQMKRKRNASETQVKPNKELKNDKNDKKVRGAVFTAPALTEVEEYFAEHGYSKEHAKRFFDYYSVGAWVDNQGNHVKNWKQKAIAVWFKEEGRIGTVCGTGVARKFGRQVVTTEDLKAQAERVILT